MLNGLGKIVELGTHEEEAKGAYYYVDENQLELGK